MPRGKMAVRNLNLPNFPTFDLSEIDTVPSRWKKYKRRFELLCTAIGVAEEKQKLAMFLTYVGDDTYEIFENTKLNATPTFNETIEALDRHFEPQANKSYETFLFRQMKQLDGENLNQFYIRLKEQAGKCEFADSDLNIKQQIELSTTNNKLRVYSFQNQEKTLQELLTIGRTYEETKKQVEVLTKTKAKETDGEEETVNFANKRRFGKNNYHERGMSNNNKKNCYRCGGKFPHKAQCPALGKTCNKCSKKNHFASVCKTSQKRGGNPNNSRNKPLNSVYYTHSPSQLYENLEPLHLDESLFAMSVNKNKAVCDMGSESKSVSDQSDARVFNKPDFDATILVEGIRVNVLVDTGASINILTLRTFNELSKRLKQKPILQKTKTKVITYGSSSNSSLKVLGTIAFVVETNSKLCCTKFHVIDTTHKNLLSGETALLLNILTFEKPIFNVQKEYDVNATSLAEKNAVPESLTKLIDCFGETVFNNTIGKLKDYEVKLHIDKNVPPVAQRERRIPFALREKVNKELEKLERAGIIEDVTDEPTPWLNPLVIVPKSDGTIRLCVDMRCANKAIKRTRYPTPTIDDLKCKLRGANVFTKLDMRSAFHQLELAKESRYITAFQSDTRIKRFTRLLFGANSAPEELQHVIRQLLADIDGVINIADDLLIYAKDNAEHDRILLQVLERFREKELTLNLRKCQFLQSSLEFYGHVFSKDGMKPNPKKVEAIVKASQPEDQKALRSFLGLANYLKAFIPNYSTITYPLRSLLKNDTEYEWSNNCDEAFTKLKSAISSDTCITYFDNRKDTFLFTDASPYGISAIVLQKSPTEKHAKIVSFSSRALTKTEMNYAQIERECLALVYGCERNRLYLLGRQFTAYNDHKALVNILNNPKSTIPLRIERLTLRLQGYQFVLKHVKSDDNISDYPSRHPYDTADESVAETTEEYVNQLAEYSCPNALTLDNIRQATKYDKLCQELIKLVQNRNWYTIEKRTDIGEEVKNELKSFRKLRNELTLTNDQQTILKGTRIVIPEILQQLAINIAHVGHQGIQKTKTLLRSKVYFKNMDKLVEQKISNCLACQAVEKQTKSTPLKNTEIPDNVWDAVNVDYLGPLPSGHYLFVLIDQRSRFPIVDLTKSTNATSAISSLSRTFSMYGNPKSVISDNGPPFTSKQFADFLQSRGVTHRRVTPVWPQANGEAERFMRPLKKTIQTAHLEKKNIASEVENFLFAYRNTPHSTTKVSPAELMFNRKPNYNLPHVQPAVDTELHRHAAENDRERKSYNKNYIDTKRHASDIRLNLGDRVLVHQPKINKLTPYYNPKPLRVTHTKGTMVTAKYESDGGYITRNVTHFKRIAPETKVPMKQNKRSTVESEPRKQYSMRKRK